MLNISLYITLFYKVLNYKAFYSTVSEFVYESALYCVYVMRDHKSG